MAFAALAKLLRDPGFGRRVVPIVPDEARTFGMDALFSQVGIYSCQGQLDEPVDKGKLLYYRETEGRAGDRGGHHRSGIHGVLHGAPARATRPTACPRCPSTSSTRCSVSSAPATRPGPSATPGGAGFMLGATAGRTTLNGEGLQHEDGHSHLLASAIPPLRADDPAFAYELAVIVRDGIERMYGRGEDLLYYVTLYNENHPTPPKPDGVDEGIVRGLYRSCRPRDRRRGEGERPARRIRGDPPAGAGRARGLAERFGVAAKLYSATSWQVLRRDALRRSAGTGSTPTASNASLRVRDPGFRRRTGRGRLRLGEGAPGPAGPLAPARLRLLGTEGFGRSDTREALRALFEIDAPHVVVAALAALQRTGERSAVDVAEAIAALGIDPEKLDPLAL